MPNEASSLRGQNASVKLRLEVVVEYEADLGDYGVATAEAAARIDQQQFDDDLTVLVYVLENAQSYKATVTAAQDRIPEGARVRVTTGDYAGKVGFYEGRGTDDAGHRVWLDGDHVRDTAVEVDGVELAEAPGQKQELDNG